MSFNFTLTLFRNETINIFKLAESSLDKLKSAKTIIREVEKKAQQNVPIVHKERRKYLRSVAHEALLILEDEPGLLAPQALLVFELLSYCRDEILWFIRHSNRDAQNKKAAEDNFKDAQISGRSRALKISGQRKQIPTEHIESICSLEFELSFVYICSI